MLKVIEAKKEDRDTVMNLLEKISLRIFSMGEN